MICRPESAEQSGGLLAGASELGGGTKAHHEAVWAGAFTDK